MTTSRHSRPQAGRTIRLFGVLSLLAAPAAANVAMWHPSMYGFEAGLDDAGRAAEPFRKATFGEWWLHGAKDQPPEAGQFLELPAGGQFKGELASKKSFTSFGKGNSEDRDQVPRISCGLALAYVPNVEELHPANFTVISVRHDCTKPEVIFDIPKNLPVCPEEGCHCLWGAADYGDMYTNAYRCKITGGWQGKPGMDPLPEPQTPKACAGRPEECVKGAKQMVIWGQREGNNIIGDGRFNDEFGWQDGVQNDIWQVEETQSMAKQPVAKVLRRDEGGDNKEQNKGPNGKDWDQKWYKQTWTLEELLQPWTEEERLYIQREVHQHWDNILSAKDYDYLDMNSLSVPAQYVVRKLRAQLWLATASKKDMPQSQMLGAEATKAPEQKPTPAEAKKTEAVKTQAKAAEQPRKTAAPKKEDEEKKKKEEEEEETKKKEEAAKKTLEDQKKVEDELKKQAEDANKKAAEENKKKEEEAKTKPEDQKKKEEDEKKKKGEEAKKEEEEKTKEEEEKKKAAETNKRSEPTPTSIKWNWANLNEYLEKLRNDGKGPSMKQIEYLKDSWREMQADSNYPPDMVKWWKGLEDRFEEWVPPATEAPAKATDGAVKLILDALRGMGSKRELPAEPTPAPRLPVHPKREMKVDSDKVLVNTLQNVQTTKLLLFNPNSRQGAKTEGVYTTKAESPAKTPVATLRGTPANAKKPSPTTDAWEPSGTYASIMGYLIDEQKHNPNYRFTAAQLRWINLLTTSRNDGTWNGEWTQNIWNFLFDMRHQKYKRWFVNDGQGKVQLQDWDTRTYRDDGEIARLVRKMEWSDDEIRGFEDSEVSIYNSLVARVEEAGGWNSGAMNKSDKDLDQQSHLRWPEIYVLRKLRFAKKKLRDSVKVYFDEHRW